MQSWIDGRRRQADLIKIGLIFSQILLGHRERSDEELHKGLLTLIYRLAVRRRRACPGQHGRDSDKRDCAQTLEAKEKLLLLHEAHVWMSRAACTLQIAGQFNCFLCV